MLSVGFDFCAYIWSTPDLSGTVQTVWDCFKSSPQVDDKGVPQGSILDPLLFTFYMNKIYFPTEHYNVHFYADETIQYPPTD